MREAPTDRGPAARLTRPFAFSEHLRPVPAGIDPLPLVDFFLLGLFALFLLQPLLFSPGVSIAMPTGPSETLAGVRADAIVTLWEDRLVTAEGSFPAGEAAGPLERLRAGLPADREATLLLLADRGLPLAGLQEVLHAATEAGFATVQVAAQPEEAGTIPGRQP